MGKRGPPPTPTAILEARGSWRAKGRKGEPEVEVKEPPCPGWLPKEAKAEWKRIVPILLNLKVLTEADQAALQNYCLAHSQIVELQRIISKEGYTYEDRGIVKKRPEVGILQNAQKIVKTFLVEFGLSPASRARLGAGAAEEGAKSEDEQFLDGADNGLRVVS